MTKFESKEFKEKLEKLDPEVKEYIGVLQASQASYIELLTTNARFIESLGIMQDTTVKLIKNIKEIDKKK